MSPGAQSFRDSFANCSKAERDSLGDSVDLYARAMAVLGCIEEQGLTLAIFLWVISWNNVHLIKDNTARHAHTALMNSEELPGILKNWYKPPRKHNSGVRTQAAHEVMTGFALGITFGILDNEISALANIMSLPQEHLSEETLLSIHWKELISDVQEMALTTWRIFRHTAYTPLQDSRNTIKDPDSVGHILYYNHVYILYYTRLSLP